MENKKIELELKKRIEKLKEEAEYQYEITESIVREYGSELAGDVWDKYNNMEREYNLLKAYFEISNKGIKINLAKLIIENGNISEIRVNANKNSYLIKFNSESISIFGTYPYLGGDYNKKTEELTWELRHTCRFHNNGLYSDPDSDSILRNPCMACRNKNKTKDEEIGRIYGNKDLEEIIEYSNKIENELRTILPKIFE